MKCNVPDRKKCACVHGVKKLEVWIEDPYSDQMGLSHKKWVISFILCWMSFYKPIPGMYLQVHQKKTNAIISEVTFFIKFLCLNCSKH